MSTPITLIWFAAYSNMTSIIVVLFSFVVMTFFIGLVSMTREGTGQFPHSPSVVKQKTMVKVSNPFFVQLLQETMNLAGGVKIQVSSLCPCEGIVLWGPKINQLHDLLLKPGKEIRKSCITGDGELYDTLCSLHRSVFQFQRAGKHSLQFPCPEEVSGEALGDMPRSRYPVVIFTFVPEPADGRRQPENDISSDIAEDTNSIIGLVSIIHLQDERVKQSSHMIGQYVKTAGVPIYCLQPLYLSTNSDSNQQDATSSNSGDTSGDQSCEARGAGVNSGFVKPVGPENCIVNSGVVSDDEGKICDDLSLKPANREQGEDEVDRTEFCDVTENLEEMSSTDNVAGTKHWQIESTSAARINLHSHGEHDSTCSRESHTTDFLDDSQRAQARRRNDCRVNNKDCVVGDTVSRNCTESEPTSLGSSMENISTHTMPECVVCQTNLATCALLPCRHACVCSGCFKLLDRCPLCRGALESYFLLSAYNGEEERDGDSSDSNEDIFLQEMHQRTVQANLAQMWENFNVRLNNFLGFR